MLESLQEVLEERAGIIARLRQPGPAWGEVRAVLDEMHGVVGD